MDLSACFYVFSAETLPWRRVADLYMMISSAVVSMLGWRLYKERVTDIFQQEEGRYTLSYCRTVYSKKAWSLLRCGDSVKTIMCI